MTRELATTAAECLLLLCVPVDQDEFRRVSARGSDFLRSYESLEAGWSAYERTATVARSMAEDCEELGATVVRQATLSDLTRGAAEFRAITMVAHMASVPVSADDVLDGDALLELVATGAQPEWQLVRSETPTRPQLTDVVAAIGRLVDATRRDLSAAPTGDVDEGRRLARHRRRGAGLLRLDRPRLDELCGPAVLRPGRCVEMADGMISAAELVAAIPETYRGFLDLRMCNSIAVGSAVRRARPLLGVGVGRRLLYLDGPMILYKTALVYMTRRRAAGHPIQYEEAMMAVSEAAR